MSTIEFDKLLLNNTKFLKPFAVSLTRDSEVAKDLMQETLFRALANKEKYHSGTNIKAWLHTIMRNIFINNYRKKIKQPVVADTTFNEVLINHNQFSIMNEAENIFKLKDIQFAIHKLPVIFNQPFILYFEGYKYYEIAKILKEPLGTVKSRIHFARKLLKEQLHRF